MPLIPRKRNNAFTGLMIALISAMLMIGGCKHLGDGESTTALPIIGKIIEGDAMSAYLELVDVHRELVDVFGATSLRADVGDVCFNAVKDFFRHSWISDIKVLRDSPLMNAQHDRYWAMIIEGVIHVRTDGPLHIAHELRHAEQQRLMGVGFWPIYLSAHLAEGYSGNFLEIQARKTQQAFDMQYPQLCLP